MSPEQPSKMQQTVQEIQSLSGADGTSLAEEWSQRRMENDPLTLEGIRARIEDIDAQIDQLSYDTDIERSLYFVVLERARLRQQLSGQDARSLALLQKDVQILQDLNRRITYWQHEDLAMEELRNGILAYEEYRAELDLDRPVAEGGVSRDAEKEAEVRTQRDALAQVLPKLTTLRRLMITEYRLSLQPNSPQLRMQVDALLSQLPPAERALDRSQLAADLRQKIRVILGTPSDDIAQRKLRTPKILALHSATINRHFDSVLQRRTDLAGETSAQAEAAKEALENEHARLLDHALSFQITSVSNQTRKVALLVRESHFGVPVEDPAPGDVLPAARPYGPLLPRDREEMRKERDAHIDALQQYVAYLRGTVLRQDKATSVPLVGDIPDPALIMEDIMTTYILPQKLNMAEPVAHGSTFLWGVHDAAWGSIGLDFDIREKRTQAILGPMYRRLGLPEHFGTLTREQKEEALRTAMKDPRSKTGESIRSVRRINDDFRRQHGIVLDRMQGSIAELKDLMRRKPPEDLALVGVPVSYDAMPPLDALRTDEEYAGAYEYLFDQLEVVLPGELQAALHTYVDGLQANLSLNINVADVETQLGTAYIRETLYALAAIVAELGTGYLLLRRGVPFAARSTMHLTPYAARLSGGAIRATAATGVNLVREIVTGPIRPPSPSLRFVGRAGMIAVAYRLHELMKRTERLESLPELEGILAAIELMQKSAAEHDAYMYQENLDSLYSQLEAYNLQMQFRGLKEILDSPKADTLDPVVRTRLIERCMLLDQVAEKHKIAFFHAFPLNHKNILRSDPKHEREDNVAVTLRVINQARRNAQHASPSLSEMELRNLHIQRLRDHGAPMPEMHQTLASLHDAYAQLYADINALIPLDSPSPLP